MKAKDTVMKEDQLIEVIYFAIESPDRDADEGWKNKQRFKAVVQAQAKISFKAGIKEVVSQLGIELCDPDVMPYFEDYYYIPKSILQAKLKEWELL